MSLCLSLSASVLCLLWVSVWGWIVLRYAKLSVFRWIWTFWIWDSILLALVWATPIRWEQGIDCSRGLSCWPLDCSQPYLRLEFERDSQFPSGDIPACQRHQTDRWRTIISSGHRRILFGRWPPLSLHALFFRSNMRQEVYNHLDPTSHNRISSLQPRSTELVKELNAKTQNAMPPSV